MGQKVNPHGIRVGVIKNWNSRWFAKDEVFGDTLVSDYNVRKYLKKELYDAGISKIEIEKYRLQLEKMIGKPVALNVVEIRQPDLDAQLVAENIARQLENRVAFRRAMKMSIRNTMRLGAKGIKINCGGRLGGAEIARSEHYHEGTIPLQTLRADIEYGFAEANTTYGKIGVKVWIYKGEVLSDVVKTTEEKTDRPRRRFNRDNKGDRNNTRRAPRAPKTTTEGGEH